MKKRRKKHRKESIQSRVAPRQQSVCRLIARPNDPKERDQLSDLLTAMIFFEFARAQLELHENGINAIQQHTRRSVNFILFLENAGTLWEAAKFIANIRDKYKVAFPETHKHSHGTAAELFARCVPDDKTKPQHDGLSLLRSVRNNGSSHITPKASRDAIDHHFDKLSANAFLITTDGRALNSTSPLALMALLTRCFGSHSESDTKQKIVLLSQTLIDILNILMSLQDALAEGLEEYFSTTRDAIKNFPAQ